MRRISLLIATTLGAAVLAAGTTASADTSRQSGPAPAAAVPRAQPQTKGCVNAAGFPFVVTNNTAGPVVVFDEPDCTGSAVGVVPPGQTQVFEFGRSAYFTQ
ncbi:hypothetical protein ABT093_28675 [Kitasatospora sp. NPDC002551]|uniref:hypothetical protein n=1 Tax=unclassified Kitasatospora TaxID=2633591 RepID=UPI00332F800F